MNVLTRLRHARKAFLSAGATVALAAGVLVGAPGASQAATLPCDIYAAGGTPCVAAHSTTRALYASYNGPLYQVRRSSDNTTRDIGVLSAGGYANAAAQDSFCSGTTLRHHRHLRPVRPGEQPHPGASRRVLRPGRGRL